MKTEEKNAGEKQVDRNNLFKLEDGGVSKDEKPGLLRSTKEVDGKTGPSPIFAITPEFVSVIWVAFGLLVMVFVVNSSLINFVDALPGFVSGVFTTIIKTNVGNIFNQNSARVYLAITWIFSPLLVFGYCFSIRGKNGENRTKLGVIGICLLLVPTSVTFDWNRGGVVDALIGSWFGFVLVSTSIQCAGAWAFAIVINAIRNNG